MRPPGWRPFPGAGCRAGRARRQRAATAGRQARRACIGMLKQERFAFAFPGHDARGIGAGPARWRAAGAHPAAPPKGAGGVAFPHRGVAAIFTCRRAATPPFFAFRRSPPPPRICMGGAGEHRRLSRRSVATDGAGPGDSGFSRGHEPAAGGRRYSAAGRRGGRPPAGAGVGGWTRRGAPTSRTSCPEMKSAGVFLPAQIVMVLPRM